MHQFHLDLEMPMQNSKSFKDLWRSSERRKMAFHFGTWSLGFFTHTMRRIRENIRSTNLGASKELLSKERVVLWLWILLPLLCGSSLHSLITHAHYTTPP